MTALVQLLDWFGIAVFAATGALVASRKQMDIFGFALLGTVTGVGGGTIRDVLGGEVPLIPRKEIYVTAALLGSTAFVAALQVGLARPLALASGFLRASCCARWRYGSTGRSPPTRRATASSCSPAGLSRPRVR